MKGSGHKCVFVLIVQHSSAVHGSAAQVVFAGLAIGCWLLSAQVVNVSHVGSEAEGGEAVKQIKRKGGKQYLQDERIPPALERRAHQPLVPNLRRKGEGGL